MLVFNAPDAWIAPVCLVGAVLSAVWTGLAYRSERRWLKAAARTSGVIESLFVQPGKLGRLPVTFYFPVVRFTTAAGVAVTSRTKAGRSGGFRVGDRINIAYNTNDPSDVEIDEFWSRWLIVIAAAFFTLVFAEIVVSKLLPR